jgi:hypothetical protein
MILSVYGTMVIERRALGVCVARFVTPDLRDQLYDHRESAGCRLFQDFDASVLDAMGPDETLVLNLGLVNPFPTEMYKCLLKVREVLVRRHGRVILCGVSAETQEILDLFCADRVFELADTEADALRLAAEHGPLPGRPDATPGVRSWRRAN